MTKQIFISIAVLLLIIGCTKKPTEPELPTTFTGKAYIEGAPRHDDIQIVNVQTADSTFTDSAGVYVLPIPEKDNTYTIRAHYPYGELYDSASTQIIIKNRKIFGTVSEMYVLSKLKIIVSTDRYSYNVGDTLFVTLEIKNCSDDTLHYLSYSFWGYVYVFVLENDTTRIHSASPPPNPTLSCENKYFPKEKHIISGIYKLRSGEGGSAFIRGKYILYFLGACWTIDGKTYSGTIKPFIGLVQPTKIQIIV